MILDYVEELSVYDKMDNLNGSGDISNEMLELCLNKVEDIEKCIKELMRTDKYSREEYYEQFSGGYEDYAKDRKDLLEVCVYNCDELYMNAIGKVFCNH